MVVERALCVSQLIVIGETRLRILLRLVLPITYTGATLYLCVIETSTLPSYLPLYPALLLGPIPPFIRKLSPLSQYTGWYPGGYLETSTLSLISLLPGPFTWLYNLCLRRRWLSLPTYLSTFPRMNSSHLSPTFSIQGLIPKSILGSMCVYWEENRKTPLHLPGLILGPSNHV